MTYDVKKPFNSTQRRFAAGDTITDADLPELAPFTVESAKAAGLIEAVSEQPANLPLGRGDRGVQARQPLGADAE